MGFPDWLLAISIFIIILALVIGGAWWYRNRKIPTPAPPNAYDAPIVWGKPTAGPNNEKNFCQLYTFPTSIASLSPSSVIVPGNPTFNSEILDSLQGNTGLPICLDSDQILAQQVQHTCTAPLGVVNGAITRCNLINGGTTGLGGSETYYTNTGCPKTLNCAGSISFISINYQSPSNGDFYCIQKEGTGNSVIMASCNPPQTDVESQLFRVTSINPGQNPENLPPGQGQNGLLTQLLDRDTGLCLVPGNITLTTKYVPSYVGCTGQSSVFGGTNVVLDTCVGITGSFPGYVWLLLPSIQYCGVTGGCGKGCTGCPSNVCFQIPGTNTCNNVGCADPSGICTGAPDLTTPPQLVYIGNLDITQLPVGPTGYAGLTGPSAVVKWLIDNNAEALYYGGTGSNLIMRPLGLDSSRSIQACERGDLGFTAQYINLTIYNTVTALAVCFADNLQNCVDL
jgi:hypothetical protein